MKQIWLNLGSGIRLLSNFINVDFAYTFEELKNKDPKKGLQDAEIDKGAEYVMADMRKLPFKDDSVDYILAFTSIEHLPIAHVVPTLIEWRRVLKKTGEMVFVTTNFDELAYIWLNSLSTNAEDLAKSNIDLNSFKAISETIYGNQQAKGEYHMCPFNPKIINWMMNQSGWPYWELGVYPTGRETPKHKGYPGSGYTCLFGELHVKGYKRIPESVKITK